MYKYTFRTLAVCSEVNGCAFILILRKGNSHMAPHKFLNTLFRATYFLAVPLLLVLFPPPVPSVSTASSHLSFNILSY